MVEKEESGEKGEREKNSVSDSQWMISGPEAILRVCTRTFAQKVLFSFIYFSLPADKALSKPCQGCFIGYKKNM
ncbi:hypothetical protein [Hymenobacter psychrophilus]|uniref:hypothetical protein n=1 Tax=Hymenobacter psychrophilus TaxID=651662 RepID=UPI000B874419|nr:hypothetical protein [Hymenobacter psychrophilus]